MSKGVEGVIGCMQHWWPFLKNRHPTLTSKFRHLHAKKSTATLVKWKSDSDIPHGPPLSFSNDRLLTWGNFLEAANQSVSASWGKPWKRDPSGEVRSQTRRGRNIRVPSWLEELWTEIATPPLIFDPCLLDYNLHLSGIKGADSDL